MNNTAAVDRALRVVGPRWTTWIVQTVHRTGPIAPVDLWKQHLPFIKYPTLTGRIRHMSTTGLLQPRHARDPVALSPRGASLQPVHAALADWSRRHDLLPGSVAEAERTEDALRRLRHTHLVPMVDWLARHPGATSQEITDGLGIAYISAVYRIDQLAADGLVELAGRSTRNRGTVHLTPAGRDVPAALSALTTWTGLHAPTGHASAPRPVHAMPQSAAAVRRSPAATSVPAPGSPRTPLFSHAETARPWQHPGTTAIRGR
ncbi:winged helix-turn-helix transcriptional regulator [Streptomyces acidiscabies]|uniref:Winged helix-turn-helix transcriptional regulator n=1 Tax=Streptomyces acidiscabies TaxID=42234 RepID=A0AAP6BLJ6_9ACTN|nr:winged helix-turn-helix transcriptional regulator [Streptomyces acidiscabies]MBZ3915274.1 winged helix-turn-helix transcriptional regulator [Streptomyces acidiscabies]MDX2967034.1 winged helix-turn-helix transcriptional regulator [Streptomyces acidiscabies]MDX3021335.1 winged helix-turn-helix transcriptional regulator [Streptomyces acidiscabies]MDX3793412.1 winged helix-turn-helix transcriptional regulator [Streptomyces acidiscabies]GAQ59474.1 HxlR-like helix-turn-helix [Streptomyces acidis